MLEFRLLRADEIEARIASVGSWGVQLLLYKDARCDMNILDETVGCLNWQRHHSRDNANCIVSIWDEDKRQWIEKEDTGTESNTEREKGLASDSFKRACFNLGIGRELYTAPSIFVKPEALKTLKEQNGKWTCKDYFTVTDITYDGKRIASVQILNQKTGQTLEFGKVATPVYTKAFLAKRGAERIGQAEIEKLTKACEQSGKSMDKAISACGRSTVEEITYVQFVALMNQMQVA